MTTTEVALLVFGILVLVLVGITIAYYMRHQHLRQRFGPEYDRVAQKAGPLSADRELRDRERRHAQLQLKELDPEAKAWYGEQWQRVQAGFVESPETAIGGADELVTRLIGERGYPVRDYDEQVALLSVDHARVIDHYRLAHDIAQQHSRGHADTEMLRQALMHYRTLVGDILGTDAALTAKALPDGAHPGDATANAPDMARTASPDATAYGTSGAARRDPATYDAAQRDAATYDAANGAAYDTARETAPHGVTDDRNTTDAAAYDASNAVYDTAYEATPRDGTDADALERARNTAPRDADAYDRAREAAPRDAADADAYDRAREAAPRDAADADTYDRARDATDEPTERVTGVVPREDAMAGNTFPDGTARDDMASEGTVYGTPAAERDDESLDEAEAREDLRAEATPAGDPRAEAGASVTDDEVAQRAARARGSAKLPQGKRTLPSDQPAPSDVDESARR